MQYRQVIGALILSMVVPAVPLGAQHRSVREIAEPTTGASVRSYRTAGSAGVELVAPGLTVKKETRGQTVVTTLSGGSERVTIEAGRSGVVVEASGSRVLVAPGDAEAADRARRLVRGSDLVKRVNALIGRMPLTVNTPGHSVLVTTRAFLLALSGDARTAETETREWAHKVARARPIVPAVASVTLVKASLQDRTPSECWAIYEKEAIAIWMEYEECLDNVSWYDFAGMAACLAIYEVKAIGAFAWWTSCVTLRT